MTPLERQIGRHQRTESREGVVERLRNQRVRGHDQGAAALGGMDGNRVLLRIKRLLPVHCLPQFVVGFGERDGANPSHGSVWPPPGVAGCFGVSTRYTSAPSLANSWKTLPITPSCPVVALPESLTACKHSVVTPITASKCLLWAQLVGGIRPAYIVSFAIRFQEAWMPQDTLTITDNRTGQSYTLPVENGTIRAMDLRKIKTGPEDFGLMTYDPAFMNTASCRSAITYIDGDRGILRYRGYPIDVLAQHSPYLEVAYLLLFGELPNATALKSWVDDITHHTMHQETTKKFMEGFRYNAHPMSMLVSTVAALSTVYPESKHVHDPENRLLQIKRLVGKMPSIAAMSYRHIVGFPYIYPDNDLTYTENFMNMLWKMVEPKYVANPVIARALDIL